ncbi:MAG: DUF1848 domain-containing protein [Chloroflexota bacterium]
MPIHFSGPVFPFAQEHGLRYELRIISASRRTDIPAFYGKWFMNRIRDGFCHWINPFGGQVYRASLRPEDCLAIVFWTRSPKPLLPHLDFLHREGYRFYFHVTINGYPKEMESHSPPMKDAIAAFRRLSNIVSPDFALWRFDPILISEVTQPDYHVRQFDLLSKQLEGYTHRCYFSFVNFYGKTERNLRRVAKEYSLSSQRPSLVEQGALVCQLRDIAAARDITLYSCCADALTGEGIQRAHCIDRDIVAKLRPELDLHLKPSPTRRDCGCVEATDIGAFDTCIFGCAYCYATNSRQIAMGRLREHDPEDTILWRPASLQAVDLASVEQVTKHKELPPKCKAV